MRGRSLCELWRVTKVARSVVFAVIPAWVCAKRRRAFRIQAKFASMTSHVSNPNYICINDLTGPKIRKFIVRASMEFIDGRAGATPPTMTSEWSLVHAIEVSLVQMSRISLPRRPSPLLPPPSSSSVRTGGGPWSWCRLCRPKPQLADMGFRYSKYSIEIEALGVKIFGSVARLQTQRRARRAKQAGDDEGAVDHQWSRHHVQALGGSVATTGKPQSWWSPESAGRTCWCNTGRCFLHGSARGSFYLQAWARVPLLRWT